MKTTDVEDGGIRENSDSARQNLFANLGLAVNDDLRFGMVVGGTDAEFGKPMSTIDDKSDPYAKNVKYERVEDYDSRFAQLSLGYDPKSLFSLRAWGYVNQSDEESAGYDDDSFSAISKKGSYEQSDETEVCGATIQGFFSSDAFGRLGLSLNSEVNTYGAKGYEIKKKGASDIDISHDIELFSAALEYETTLFDRLAFVAGYSHHWQNKDLGEDDDKGAWLLGLSYDMTMNTRLRASYARKVRFASIKNLYDPSAGNEDLNTETSDNYEVGVTQALPWGITADVALFRNNVENFINKVEQEDGDDLYENHDEYRYQGVELLLSKPFAAADISLGYSYMDAQDKSEGSYMDDIEYCPVHKFTLEGDYTFGFGLTAYASLEYLAGQIYYGDEGDPKGELDDIVLVNLKLEQWIYKNACAVYIGVDNLLDEDYEESYGFPQAGRTAYVGAKFRF